MQKTLFSNLLKIENYALRWTVIISIFVKVSSYFFSIFIGVVFYYLIREGLNPKKEYILIVLIICIVRFFLGHVLMRCEKKVRSVLTRWLGKLVLKTAFIEEKKEVLMEIGAKSFPIYLELYLAVFDIFSYCLFFIILSILTIIFLGSSYYFLIFLNFFFISFVGLLIARKTSFYTAAYMESMHFRVKKIQKWIKLRSYFQNWGFLKESLQQVESILMEEKFYRNWDSFWRSLDHYLSLFSGFFTIVLMILCGISTIESHKSILFLWLIIPITTLLLQIARYPSLYVQARSIHNDFLKLSNKDNVFKNDQIVLDQSWDIWEGSFSENILHSLSKKADENIKELRLTEDFSMSSLLDLKLEEGGNNISAGQKDRILLLRALHLSEATGYKLSINLDFSTLDENALSRVFNIVKKYREHINCAFNNHIKLNSHPEKEIVKAHGEKRKVKGEKLLEENIDYDLKLVFLLKMLNPFYVFLFAFPAVFCTMIPSLSKELSLNNLSYLSYLSILCLLSFFTATYAGFYVEQDLRKKGIDFALNILKKANFKNMSDILQRLTRDLNIYFEKLIWYSHDILWYSSIIIVNIIILYFSIKEFLALPIFILLFISYLAWLYFSPRVKESQKKYIKNHTLLLKNMSKYTAQGNAAPILSQWSRLGSKMENSLDSHLSSSVSLLFYKSVYMMVFQLVSGLFVTACSFYLSENTLDKSLYITSLTALLMIDQHAYSIAQILNGYITNGLSYIRLICFPYQKVYPSTAFSVADNQIMTRSFFIKELGVSTIPLCLKTGCVYKLEGFSGEGKTVLLKTLSCFPSSSELFHPNSSIIYVDSHYKKVLEFLNKKTCFSEILKLTENNKIIIFDEIFSGISLKAWHESIEEINVHVKKFNQVCLITDHSYNIENMLTISDFIVRKV